MTGTRLVSVAGPGGNYQEHTEHDPLPFGNELPGAELANGDATAAFTSYRRAAAGIDYALNRFYHPRLGRFLQPDPIGPAAFPRSRRSA
ncbi:MAG: hypothetical protein ACR2LI_01435 [Propionibacteriaceae bacterium]